MLVSSWGTFATCRDVFSARCKRAPLFEKRIRLMIGKRNGRAALVSGILAMSLALGVGADRSGGADDKASGTESPMFGGTPSRNLVNTVDKNVPTEWSIQPGSEKNVKWIANVGSKAYGGPVVAGGKVFVGTNNEVPRNPAAKGSGGVVMCFSAADGKFLWQAYHP